MEHLASKPFTISFSKKSESCPAFLLGVCKGKAGEATSRISRRVGLERVLLPTLSVSPQDVVDFYLLEQCHKVCMGTNASRIFPHLQKYNWLQKARRVNVQANLPLSSAKSLFLP